mgnify:CR=1 FL=1
MNPYLKDLITSTGGSIFNTDDGDRIVETVKRLSKRTKSEIIYYRFPFIITSIVILLVEIAVRRIYENRNLYK